MADSRPPPNSGDDSDPGPASGSTGTPRWVKVFGLVAVILVLLVAVMVVAGHGPGDHMPSADAGRETPPSDGGDHPRRSGGDLGDHTPAPGIREHGGSQP
jgi:hypothetical protein